MRKLFLLLSAACILSFPGCGLGDNQNSADIEISKRIILQPAAENERLVLAMRTEEHYAYGGFTIENYAKLNGRVLDLYINGVKSPSDGGMYTMATAPASASVNLSSLSGEYRLIVRSKNFADNYKLIVGEDFARLEGDTTKYTKPYPFVHFGE